MNLSNLFNGTQSNLFKNDEPDVTEFWWNGSLCFYINKLLLSLLAMSLSSEVHISRWHVTVLFSQINLYENSYKFICVNLGKCPNLVFIVY